MKKHTAALALAFGFALATPGALGQQAGAVARPMPPRQPPQQNQPPPTPGWSQNATQWRGRIGQSFSMNCPGNGTAGVVWGTDVYTDDSSLCTAAAHAGRLTMAQGGSVVVYVWPGQQRYAGSARGGVTSSDYGPWPGSFSFAPPPPSVVPRTPPGTTLMPWESNGTEWRGRAGFTVRLFCAPGGHPGSVWGSGPFTDDSSVCTAAAHAGLLSVEQGGVFTLRVAEGQAFYPASLRNGIFAGHWGAAAGSFELTR